MELLCHPVSVSPLSSCAMSGELAVSSYHVRTYMYVSHTMILPILASHVDLYVQVFGRFLVVFVVLRPSVEIHTHPIVFALFLVWSLIEVIRSANWIVKLKMHRCCYVCTGTHSTPSR